VSFADEAQQALHAVRVRVAVCCSVLPGVAVCCGVLKTKRALHARRSGTSQFALRV